MNPVLPDDVWYTMRFAAPPAMFVVTLEVDALPLISMFQVPVAPVPEGFEAAEVIRP